MSNVGPDPGQKDQFMCIGQVSGRLVHYDRRPVARTENDNDATPIGWRLLNRAAKRMDEWSGLDARDRAAASRDRAAALLDRSAGNVRRVDELRRLAIATDRGVPRWRRQEKRRAQQAVAELDDLLAEVTAETESIESTLGEAREIAGDARKHSERQSRRLAIAFLLIQLVCVGALLAASLLPGTSDRGVHVQFYGAVAAIAPIILAAGFVELPLLRVPAVGYSVAAFAVAPVTAGTAALVALARNQSTAAELSLSSFGLFIAIVQLVTYVIIDATDRRYRT
jgi:hypothetical protein